MFTPESISRPWITYEAAWVRGRGSTVVPLYHFMDPSLLPEPLQIEQAYDGTDETTLFNLRRKLFGRAMDRDPEPELEKRWKQEIAEHVEVVRLFNIERRRHALFHGQFHSTSSARRLEGKWWAKWTIHPGGDRGVEEPWGTIHPIEILPTRWRIRLVGEADQERNRLYPCEGVVSVRGDVALSYWSDTGSHVCGTVLLKNFNDRRLVGSWQGFSTLDLDAGTIGFVEGRAILVRDRDKIDAG